MKLLVRTGLTLLTLIAVSLIGLIVANLGFSLFYIPKNSTTLRALTVVYFLVSSITTLDIRIIQGKKHGDLPPDEPMLPSWTGIFPFMQWGLWLAFLFMFWQYAVFLFFVKFVLKVLPVLETLGNILMAPFKPKSLS